MRSTAAIGWPFKCTQTLMQSRSHQHQACLPTFLPTLRYHTAAL